MADLKNFTLDKAKAESGVWVQFDEDNAETGDKGTRFLIGSSNSREYEKQMIKEFKPYQHPAKKHLLDNPDIILKHRIRGIAKCVLLGWENLKNGGVDFPYSEENAIAVLTQSPDIRSFIESESQKAETFNLAVEEDAAGSLKSGS
jgi:hypothetical protein